MIIYYKYEVNNEDVIVAIHSSNLPFNENQISQEIVFKIVLGKTTVQELDNLFSL